MPNTLRIRSVQVAAALCLAATLLPAGVSAANPKIQSAATSCSGTALVVTFRATGLGNTTATATLNADAACINSNDDPNEPPGQQTAVSNTATFDVNRNGSTRGTLAVSVNCQGRSKLGRYEDITLTVNGTTVLVDEGPVVCP